jgi:hypothetical protein
MLLLNRGAMLSGILNSDRANMSIAIMNSKQVSIFKRSPDGDSKSELVSCLSGRMEIAGDFCISNLQVDSLLNRLKNRLKLCCHRSERFVKKNGFEDMAQRQFFSSIAIVAKAYTSQNQYFYFTNVLAIGFTFC